MTTVGWESIPGDYEKLSKEQAKEAMEELIREGYNPNLMRAVQLMELPDDFMHRLM